MTAYISDGKQLLNVEYDVIPEISDSIDGMIIISKLNRDNEYALFMIEANRNICCYVLDEIFIMARVSGFENLMDAVEAWKNNEI